MGDQSRTADEGRNRVKSFEKMMRILDCFSKIDRGLTLGEIAARLDLPKATTHRALATLRDFGLIEQERERDRYRLGIKLFELGNIVLANLEVQREAPPFIEHVRRLTGEAVNLGVFDGANILIIDRKEDVHRVVNLLTMEGAPCYCTGLGKAVLAHQSADRVDKVIRAGLIRHTRNTITDAGALRRELAAIRARGYAIDNAELQNGVRCLAAPIHGPGGGVHAALSVSSTTVRLTDDRIEAVAEIVMEAARGISLRLGFRDGAQLRFD